MCCNTKEKIALAVKELMRQKSIRKITVQDIMEETGMKRQSFYYHFQDITDLIEWICVEDADKALKDKSSYETWQDGFLAVFDLMKKDYAFIMNIYRSISHEILTKYLYKLVYPIIYQVVDEKSKGYVVREDDKKFITDFYKYSFVAIVLNWIDGDMKDDQKKIVKRVSDLITGTIENSLKNMRSS